MGTRGLTKVIKNGEIVVAQYGQWDHYASGQGATAFFAVQRPDVIERLSDKVDTLCYYPSEEEREAMWKPFEDGSMAGMMSFESGKKFSELYPSMTRDTGAEILYVIADAEDKVPLFLDIDFEKDELFCEGVLTINLDDQTFTSNFGEDVVLTFDEVREMTIKDYLAKFMDEQYAIEYANAINSKAVA
jgi:hypothetical protein